MFFYLPLKIVGSWLAMVWGAWNGHGGRRITFSVASWWNRDTCLRAMWGQSPREPFITTSKGGPLVKPGGT